MESYGSSKQTWGRGAPLVVRLAFFRSCFCHGTSKGIWIQGTIVNQHLNFNPNSSKM